MFGSTDHYGRSTHGLGGRVCRISDWNGNKNGPFGIYPQRDTLQLAGPKPIQGEPRLYRGDMNENPDKDRVNWDRYLGHNIACIAVDGNGHIVDFDFNHYAFFRSSAEHAESRLVRRLFSLTGIFDSWKTGPRINNKPHAASLGQITLYTSLESCAQCSRVMSLAGVKQIIYLQKISRPTRSATSCTTWPIVSASRMPTEL